MDEIKKIILEEIKILDNKRKDYYKVTYSNEYYLNMMLHLLKDLNNWSFLENIKGYGEGKKENIPKYHYKTIQNKFYFWSSKNIFKNAFEKIKYNVNSNILLIVSTNVQNKNGSENITINPEYKKKKGTKLSIITNTMGFIFSILPFKINKTLKNKSKTSIHDVKMLDETLKNIKQDNNSKYYYLIGDKAYKNSLNLTLNNKKVIMITPDKKNTIIKNSHYKNKKLKKRVKIEHSNLEIKRYERCMVRKDKKLNNFLSWIYISSLLNNIRILKKLDM
jgi:hypothetical protein